MVDKAIRYIKGVGPQRERMLNRLGIFTARDLLYHFPVKYEDRTQLTSVNRLEENKPALVLAEVATVREVKGMYGRKGRIEAVFRDDTGSLLVVWFNQPYVRQYLHPGKRFYLYGKPRMYNRRMQLVSPEYDEELAEAGDEQLKIVPIYRLTQGVTQSSLRKLIHGVLHETAPGQDDPLPFLVRQQFGFPEARDALLNVHCPESPEKLAKARERFIFEEFFLMQLAVYQRKAAFRSDTRTPIDIDHACVEQVLNNFGYSLTASQRDVLDAILGDLCAPYRSSRLLQGDVGSGKTIVTLIAAFCVARAGHQVALMVPTEVLAYQHQKTIERLSEGTGIKSALLTSSTKAAERRKIIAGLESGDTGIVVGTHALLNEQVSFKSLRFVIIDEQHRFGVYQRAVLGHKGDKPDILVMSATPIPRTLALTAFGDLDVSRITEYPAGRQLPQSRIVTESQREQVYRFIDQRLDEGRQVYFVYALVEDSEDEESDLRSATDMFDKLQKRFGTRRLGLLHGRLKSQEKTEVLEKFRRAELDILVSTLVVEVGVDVPNATTMVVENPERFGLSQLHQLRGRIMRSSHKSYFVMLTKASLGGSTRQRLKVVEETCDGFVIAESDLKLRGPGDLFGIAQSGFLNKRLASVERDFEILKEARRWAHRIISQDPALESPSHDHIRSSLHRQVYEVS